MGIPHASNSSEEKAVTQINKQTLSFGAAAAADVCGDAARAMEPRDGILVKMERCAESRHTSEEPHTTEAGSGHLSQLPARTSFLLSFALPSSASKSDNSGLAMLDSKSSLTRGLSRHICLLQLRVRARMIKVHKHRPYWSGSDC